MLSQLEMFGFKSFADRTSFTFSHGITGVVGPNGSGKSNVVDAVKWILGDQSAKSLRGKEMTDVIFNGSTSRKGSQFAEATLVFDNTTRFLPVEMDVVSIGRRLWQSGDSEYLINRQHARLKDVRELFMGTGAGASAYCIIEQGRVDQILQSNASNRRLIFEEAAGISRLKSRRTDSLRRLDRVEQNLVRLADLVDAAESQLNTLRSQAQKAIRYREYAEELQQLWVGLAADEYRRQDAEQAELAARIERRNEEVAAIRIQQHAAARRVEELDTRLTTIEDEFHSRQRAQAEIRSQIASLETTLLHQRARTDELDDDRERLRSQQQMLDGRVAEAEAELEHATAHLNREQQHFANLKGSQTDDQHLVLNLQKRVEAIGRQLAAQRRELMDCIRQNSNANTEHASLMAEHQRLSARRVELRDDLTAANAHREAVRENLAAARLDLEKAERALSDVESRAVSEEAKRRELVGQQAQTQSTLAELREHRSASIARRSVLEDLEDRQEGFGIGVREILERAESSPHPPWNSIHGTVADLLEVDLENAALLEVALASRCHLLVVDDLQPVVDYLNTGRCRITDRVGFVAIPGLTSAPGTKPGLPSPAGFPRHAAAAGPDEAIVWYSDSTEDSSDDSTAQPASGRLPGPRQLDLTGRRGIVSRADALARSPKEVPNLTRCLLSDTWLTQTLDDALRLAKETGGQCRFVTLQGELVEQDGTLFTGTIRAESSVMSRKSELRRLKKELRGIEHQIAQREFALRSLMDSIGSADDDVQAAQQSVRQHARARQGAENRVHELDRELVRADELQSDLILHIETRSERLKEIAERITTAEQVMAAGEEIVQELSESIARAERAIPNEQKRVESLETERQARRVELSRFEERLSSSSDVVERLHAELHQRTLQQQEARRRVEVALSNMQRLRMDTLRVTSEVSELHVRSDQADATLRSQGAIRRALREERQAATTIEADYRKQQNRLESSRHELELQKKELTHRVESVGARIRDEFQIEVADAVKQGASAIRIWLNRSTDAARRSAETESTVPVGARNDAVDDVEPSDAEGSGATAAFNQQARVQAILNDSDSFHSLREEVDQRIQRLRRRMKALGSVSTESLDNLAELEDRFERLSLQLGDLEAARDALRDMVRRINVESKRLFVETFETVRGHFRELFRALFGGGEADVILEDPDDVLECGVEIVARPPGKELRSISLLSGGEKTLTAVALLLSIFKSRPSPFCILDEVDAALDDANIGRFVNVLKQFQDNTQFILITHRKPTMAVTDLLYGVTMEESGVSKRLSVKFDEVGEKGEIVNDDDAGDQRMAA